MACGESQPTASTIEPTSTPDIEATVEERLRIEATVVARIEEKQAEDAALEVKAQAMAKAMVEATAQAVSTARLYHRHLRPQQSHPRRPELTHRRLLPRTQLFLRRVHLSQLRSLHQNS